MLTKAIFILGFPLIVIGSTFDFLSPKPPLLRKWEVFDYNSIFYIGLQVPPAVLKDAFEDITIDDNGTECWTFGFPISLYSDGPPVFPELKMLEYEFAFTARINEFDQLYWNGFELFDEKDDNGIGCWTYGYCEFDQLYWNGFELFDEKDDNGTECWTYGYCDGRPVFPELKMLEYEFAFTTRINEFDQLYWNGFELFAEKDDNGTECWTFGFPISLYSDGPLVILEPKMLEYEFAFTTRINEFDQLYWNGFELFDEKDDNGTECWTFGFPISSYCDGPPVILEPKMLEYEFAFTTRINEFDQLYWNGFELFAEKEYLTRLRMKGYKDPFTTRFLGLNYKISMESLHGIDSASLFAFALFFVTVLSTRRVSEEELIKDTVYHSNIVKTTTKETRQNFPTKVEEEAVCHCELCVNHDQAIAYCKTCKLNICMSCNGLHKRVWTLMNHTVCPFNDSDTLIKV